MKKNTIETQVIGLDVGRGYVKGYTEWNENSKEYIFKSIVSLGRNMDFSNFEEPIYLEVDKEDFFVGVLAEVEGDNPIQNLKDDKTTPTVEKLICAALNELALTDNVNIMLGVPNKLFKKSILAEIETKYKGKEFKIKDKIKGSYKNVTINNISIFREANAALLWHVRKQNAFKNSLAMVTIGFRTTEFSFYDSNLKFNDKLSDTKELGNKTALEFVQRKLKEEGIMKTLPEIDSSDRYDKLKEIAYRNLSESICQEIESKWTNLSEIDVFIAGGTALNLDIKDYSVVDDAQMITAKGLWLVGKQKFE